MSPEPASHDPEEFVDGSQPWPRLLALKDGELLAKGEIFEHQTAARPKPAKHGSEPEPKQVKHGNQVIEAPLADCPAKLLISLLDRIVTSDNATESREEISMCAWTASRTDCYITCTWSRKSEITVRLAQTSNRIE